MQGLSKRYQSALAWCWALLVAVLLAHNGWLLLGHKLAPDTDILALLPVQQRDPVLQQSFNHMVDSAQQRVVVLIGAEDWQRAKAAASAYRQVLAQRSDVFSSTALSESSQAQWLQVFQQHRLGLLTQTQVAQLQSQPPDYWRDLSLAKLYGAFSGPQLLRFQDDPFDLFSGWVQERAQETPVRPRDGELFVANPQVDAKRQYVLLPLTLKPSAFSLQAQELALPLLERAALAARASGSSADPVEVISSGVVLHAGAAGQQASGEVSTIGIGSLLGIVLMMWFSFHSLKPISMILLSIGIGFLGALSVCSLLFERIHLLTLVFGASLIGVAQDYGIYFLCQRLGLDASANPLPSSTLLRRLMPGLCLTLLTTVVGYLALALTPFPGLRQMALFSALGLVFAWLTVLCWFPPMLQAGTLRSGALTRVYGRMLAHWPRWQWNRASALALLLFAGLAAWGIARLGVNDDIRALQTPPKQLLADQIKLGRLLDAPTPVQYFLLRANSSELLLQREEALKLKLDSLIQSGQIGGYQAISNWVPSQQRQNQQRALVLEKLLGQNAGSAPLVQVAQATEQDAAWVAASRQGLLAAGQNLTPEKFLQSPASEPWRHLWLDKIGNDYASIVALRGLQRSALPALQASAQGLPGVQWVDKVAEISSVLGRYRQNMGWVVLVGYGVVWLLLLPRYRRQAWRVLLPGALASIATLALFGWIGQSLQLFHVLALMLLLSVGVDYGIFMQEHGDRRDSTPWLAVGLSALSTILSFGLLALSHTAALQAFGLTMLLGTTLAWLLVPCFAGSGQEKLENRMNHDQA